MLAAGAAALFLLKTADNISEKLRYTFDRISFKIGSNILQSVITARMTITNPTNTSVKVQSISGDLIYNGQPAGRFDVNTSFTIAPQGNTSTEVIASVRNASLFGSLITSVIKKQRPSATLKGYLNTSAGSIPFTYSFTAPAAGNGTILDTIKDIFNRPTQSATVTA
jgi:hypothetical protein